MFHISDLTFLRNKYGWMDVFGTDSQLGHTRLKSLPLSLKVKKEIWIFIAHRREHASNALPLPVRRR